MASKKAMDAELAKKVWSSVRRESQNFEAAYRVVLSLPPCGLGG